MRFMKYPLASLVVLLGCHGEDVVYTPSVMFLAPAADATLPSGDVDVSIVVDDFDLTAPETAARAPALVPFPLRLVIPTAEAHSEGGLPAGYCALELDDVEVAQLVQTQASVAVGPGEHTLSCALTYADGDPLEPPVAASVTFTAE
jgi:hypothetical protein